MTNNMQNNDISANNGMKKVEYGTFYGGKDGKRNCAGEVGLFVISVMI